MRFKCNAKINYNLKIVGKKDSYHLIDSVFIPINIYDYITIRKNNVDNFCCDKDIDFSLINKCVDLFRAKFNINDCFYIYLEKNIPLGSGLGGGSSDATFLLLKLLKMYKIKINDNLIIDLLMTLGCDCPFFLYNKISKVKGFGEIIEEINYKPVNGLLIFDDIHISTKEIFSIYDTLDKKDDSLENDLENAIYNTSYSLDIKRIKNRLYSAGASYASMTGSGSGIFGIFDSKKELNEAYKLLKNEYSFVKKVKSL